MVIVASRVLIILVIGTFVIVMTVMLSSRMLLSSTFSPSPLGSMSCWMSCYMPSINCSCHSAF